MTASCPVCRSQDRCYLVSTHCKQDVVIQIMKTWIWALLPWLCWWRAYCNLDCRNSPNSPGTKWKYRKILWPLWFLCVFLSNMALLCNGAEYHAVAEGSIRRNINYSLKLFCKQGLEAADKLYNRRNWQQTLCRALQWPYCWLSGPTVPMRDGGKVGLSISAFSGF